jgi:hypothetical protein
LTAFAKIPDFIPATLLASSLSWRVWRLVIFLPTGLLGGWFAYLKKEVLALIIQ